MTTTYALVDFRGDQLLSLNDRGTIRVAVKPICDRLGIDWSTQLAKLKRDPVLSEGMVLSPIPSERGTQETVTLPLDLLHGWLFKLNPERVKPAARTAVLAYQSECYQVLTDYWRHGVAINPRQAQRETSDRALAYRELPKLLRELEGMRNPASRRLIHRMIVELCEERGYEPPEIEEIGRGTPAAADLVANFFDILGQLEDAGHEIDHSYDPAYLAIRLSQIEEMVSATRPGFKIGSHLRQALKQAASPLFVGAKTVRSKLDPEGRSVHAWVFLRPSLL